ncbi:CPBP family glutamic-type intramembrane protease [Deinococcus cellulosilyticus]|uniref:CPBP family intramembrane metalloprotease n=1 Tax=Deinococcus cellulosilyticus (strain DSM 18568 / NBRC 106333 / KACC 11606 / 5516J-15) TaxID=1223518 RepID=A0A511N4P6_DEIC1|nr:CPBP family glutamic-type intramembrane protease [Deinococcus cellulosilyticus]GEM47416.1 hypothetical protein DC3_30510 [Deinococcus cellulosilyticus NBRC 106333 = KACC 11606]
MFQPIREWWQFLLRPSFEKTPVLHLNHTFFLLLVFQCLLSFLSLLIPNALIPNFEKLADDNDVRKMIEQSGLIWTILGAAFVEEVIFRLPIGPYRSRYLIPGGLMLVLLGWAFKSMLWMQVVIAFGMGLFVLGILGLHYDYKDMLRDVWRRAFPVMFYLFALIFALVHLSNYNEGLKSLNVFTMLLLVIPQFLAGLTFGYVRHRMGFLNAVAIHAAYNAVFLVPLVGFSSQ